MSGPIITLTTDYGTRDWYVGALKGVISGIAPAARPVDITHEIEPQDVRHGAFVLWRIWSCFPEGTIHLVVVDPGVGTTRGIVVGRYASQYVVAPDNGSVTFVEQEFVREALHRAENRKFFGPELSATFHGRDIMAPVAAHLAAGVKIEEVGPAADRVALLPLEIGARREGDRLCGRVLHVDRFGTLVSNIRAEQLDALGGAGGRAAVAVTVDGAEVGPVRSTFADVPPVEVLALVGGSGLLEVAVNQGRAVDRFGGDAGLEVRVV